MAQTLFDRLGAKIARLQLRIEAERKTKRPTQGLTPTTPGTRYASATKTVVKGCTLHHNVFEPSCKLCQVMNVNASSNPFASPKQQRIADTPQYLGYGLVLSDEYIESLLALHRSPSLWLQTWGRASRLQAKPPARVFDAEKCTCGHPPHRPPCAYCESGGDEDEE